MALTPKQYDSLVAELKTPDAEQRLAAIEQSKKENPLACPVCGSHIRVVEEIDSYPHGLKIEPI